jgi:PLP dependent protein
VRYFCSIRMQNDLVENLSDIRAQIAETCRACHRQPGEIAILAVTKTFPADRIRDAVEAGLTDIGESRVQEAESKFAELGHLGEYHLIGHLQSNKVKKAVQLFDVIQSVDSLPLAQEISRRAGELGRTIDCLIEVNSSGEEQKFGVSPDHILELLRDMQVLPSIRVTGLMTVGPLTEDDDLVRAAFHMMRRLFEQGRELAGEPFRILSMGMSSDFQLAIEEGSTMIRIGTGLFGSRTPKPEN